MRVLPALLEVKIFKASIIFSKQREKITPTRCTQSRITEAEGFLVAQETALSEAVLKKMFLWGKLFKLVILLTVLFHVKHIWEGGEIEDKRNKEKIRGNPENIYPITERKTGAS